MNAVIVAVFVVCGLLVAFVPAPPRDEPIVSSVAGVRVAVDRQTGCEYLTDGRSLTPRLSSTGQPICGKKS